MSRPFDPAAPVARFKIGQRVSWQYGDKRRAGHILSMAADDSVYCDNTGDGYAPWGNPPEYFGRITWIRCDKQNCFCQAASDRNPSAGHCCNECQLSPDRDTVFVELALF